MFIIAVLNLIKIYQARHPDINPRSSGAFTFLAMLILISVIGVVSEHSTHLSYLFSLRSISTSNGSG